MNKDKDIDYIEYTEAPDDVRESFDRAVVVPNFELTPEGIREFAESRNKKVVSIYLTTKTIEKFKRAAEKENSKYQTMISNVLDAYTEQYLT